MMEKGTSLQTQTEVQSRESTLKKLVATWGKKRKKANSVLPEQSGTEAFIKPSNALFPE